MNFSHDFGNIFGGFWICEIGGVEDGFGSDDLGLSMYNSIS